MRSLAVLSLLALAISYARADVRCSGTGCGAELVAKGWIKIAECNDHNWSYLLQKDAAILLCTGVAGRAGPIESPCQAFKGNLAQYRVVAAKLPAERIAGGCVLDPAVTGKTER
jgi:hypothetical protein